MIADDDGFKPEDMEEMSERLESVIRDSEKGYIMEFTISRKDARELVTMWEMARSGDTVSAAICLMEYAKIMRQLQQALEDDDD